MPDSDPQKLIGKGFKMSQTEIIAPGSTFSQLAGNSWNALKGKWGITIGTFLIAVAIQSAASQVPVLGPLTAAYLLSPLNAGIALFILRIIRNEQPQEIGVIFEPFSQYWRYVWVCVRVAVFVFLWTLLLIIPGIIAAMRYSMVYYIMLDDPQLSAKEAMEESSAIMYGHKWQYFGYYLLFCLILVFGTFCTFGIGLIWLIPWSASFMAHFYESIRRPSAAVLPELETAPESAPPREDSPAE